MQGSQIPPSEDDSIPTFGHWTWATLELVMTSLAANPASRLITRSLLDHTRLQSPFLPADQIRKELALIFAAVIDPSFPGEGQTMT